MIMIRRGACLLALVTLLLTACGSSPPPSARSLLKAAMPTCSMYSPPTGGMSIYAQDEMTCVLPDSTLVDLAVFGNPADQRSWMLSQDPGSGSCCVEGDGWAASILGEPFSGPAWSGLERIGGRAVS